MKTYKQRINNIIGQLNGISERIDNSENPMDLVVQMKAAKSAVNSLMVEYIAQNFWDVMEKCTDDKNSSCKKFLQEIINQ
jgi:DNA-binding FrmR family transcriptional regulator